MPRDSNTLRIGIPALDSLLVGLKCLREENGQCLDVASFWHNCLEISAEGSLQDVQRGLARLKEARKALDALEESIDVSVRRLSQLTELTVLAAGIASLPDELLARIFELYAENHNIEIGLERSKKSSVILASVCRRFRNIAIHIPALWKIVSHDYSPEHILMHKSRCQSPRVYVHYLEGLQTAKQISQYIEELHPNDKWQELNICYAGLTSGQLNFEGILETVHSPFSSLHSLTIHNLGQELSTEDEVRPPTQLTEVSHQILDTWLFPVLTSLKLTNVIPRHLLCPSLMSLSTTFYAIGETGGLREPYKWDLASLKHLLGSLKTLSSLYISFYALDILTTDVGTHPVVLPNLSALTIDIHGRTAPEVLTAFMGTIEIPILAKLEIGMSGKRDDDPMPEAWLRALFWTSAHGIRKFPTVQEFQIRSEIEARRLPYNTMFAALSNLQKLSMSLPRLSGPNFKNLALNGMEVRSLHLRNCDSFKPNDILPFFEHLKQCGELYNFELLEVENAHGLKDGKDALEAFLGKKLVWKP